MTGDSVPAVPERLWPGPLGWTTVVGFAVFGFIALLPVDLGAAVVAGAVVLVVGVVLAVRTSPVVAVSDGDLVAGRAHIPVSALGVPEALDRAGVRSALGPGSDARTYTCLRSWVPGAVLVPVEDPADPTPAWLVSSRRPASLVSAIRAAQGRSQAAHSEQIS